jgi:integrase
VTEQRGRRRGRGEGSVFKRPDGRWCIRVRLPGGQRRDFYGKTQAEARANLAAALRTLEEAGRLPSHRETVGRYLADWITTVKPSIRVQTWMHYEQYLRLHAVPRLGRLSLARLDRRHLHELYAEKLREGLSPTTVRHLHAALRRALADAVRWGMIARNPAAVVTPPRAARHEIRPLTPEQARALLGACAGERLGALYVLALTTGMRRGELLGLRWADVDLVVGVLGVRATLYRAEGKLVLAEPKTARSRRLIHLTPEAVAALRAHRDRQLQERLQLGPAWDAHDLVFANELGRPVEAQNMIRRSFYPLLERAGLPRIRFHDLRHSTATLLLTGGVHPKVVSEILGHATVGITLDIYSHVLPAMHREAVGAMSLLLAPRAPGADDADVEGGRATP